MSRKENRRSGAFVSGIVAMAVSTSAVLAGCGTTAAEDVMILRFAHSMPALHPITQNAIVPWMEEVTDRTGGKVQFEHFPGGQLVEMGETMPAVRTGVVDITFFVVAQAASSDLPLTDVSALPGFGADLTLAEMQQAYSSVIESTLSESDFKPEGIRPLMGILMGKYGYMHSGAPITDIEQFRGQSIRIDGGISAYVASQLGGSPVQLGSGEFVEALQRGTVDATLTTNEAIPSYDLQEVVDATTSNVPFGAGPGAVVINDETWQALPANVQQAMDIASESAVDRISAAYEGLLANGKELGSEGGLEFYEASPELLAAIEPVAEYAQDKWIDQGERAGKPAREVLRAWRDAIREVEQGREP